jgi:Transposase DDE domain
MAVRGLGCPVRFTLTAGKKGDAPQGDALIEGLPAEVVLADAAYDSDRLRQTIADKGAVAVIPNNPSRARKQLDRHSRCRDPLHGWGGPYFFDRSSFSAPRLPASDRRAASSASRSRLPGPSCTGVESSISCKPGWSARHEPKRHQMCVRAPIP